MLRLVGAAFSKGDLKVAHTAVDATNPAAGDDPSRRDFIHIAAITAAAGGGVAAIWPFVAQMNPSADTLALASVEYDLTKIEPAQQVVINWRGKPLFIRNRTEARSRLRWQNAPTSAPTSTATRRRQRWPVWKRRSRRWQARSSRWTWR